MSQATRGQQMMARLTCPCRIIRAILPRAVLPAGDNCNRSIVKRRQLAARSLGVAFQLLQGLLACVTKLQAGLAKANVQLPDPSPCMYDMETWRHGN